MKNKIKKQLKSGTSVQAGFSLLEIMISLSIFSIIIGGVVLFSVRTLEAHTKSQAMQNAMENARFAVETMNKRIRTSNDVYDDDPTTQFVQSSEIVFTDNVDESKYCYIFSGTVLEVSKAPDTSTATDCSHGDFAVFTELVGGGTSKIDVAGRFFIKQTDGTSNERGFVRTVIEISHNDSSTIVAEKDSVKIQSGVSLRDY